MVRWYVAFFVTYQCTICIYMYKHTDTLVHYEKRTLIIYIKHVVIVDKTNINLK